MRSVFSVLLCCILFACHQLQLHEQESKLAVNGGNIWYRVVGTGHQTPIVLVHGGPGFPSYSLEPLFDLSDEHPVIVFDQLGCGRSDKITDTNYMSVQAHMDQLQKLLQHLGVKEFYLYSHSYGTMVAMDYYLAHPEGIKALILASPCMNTQ